MNRLAKSRKKEAVHKELLLLESGGDLLSRAVSSQVPSALKVLTSVFGMGTGGTPSPLPPEIVSFVGAEVGDLSLIILAQGTVASSLGVFLSLGTSVPAYQAARPFSCALRHIKFNACYALAPFAPALGLPAPAVTP